MEESLETRLTAALEGRTDVELAILFGSRARGQAREDSDVDLAVQGQDLDLLTLAAELSRAIGKEVDLADLRHAGYPLLKVLLQQGIVVHQGRRNAEGEWRSQALSRVALDRHWYERMRNGFLRGLAAERDG